MGSEKSLHLQPNMDSFSFSNMGSQQSDFDLESTYKRQEDEVGIETFDQGDNVDDVDSISEYSF